MSPSCTWSTSAANLLPDELVVVATDIQDARKFAKMKWRGSANPHIDAVKLVSVIDGYRVNLEPTEDVDSSRVDPTYVP